jgi:hypothetical protein
MLRHPVPPGPLRARHTDGLHGGVGVVDAKGHIRRGLGRVVSTDRATEGRRSRPDGVPEARQ